MSWVISIAVSARNTASVSCITTNICMFLPVVLAEMLQRVKQLA